MSQVQDLLIQEVATVQFMSIFSDFWALFGQKLWIRLPWHRKKKIKELSMNDLVLGENKQVQKVSLKSEIMCEKLCSISTENCS